MRRPAWRMCRNYFNPRSPHGERRTRRRQLLSKGGISIHAPRTGSDCRPVLRFRPPRHFNPRSPHGERQICMAQLRRKEHFNPRSPHGERPLFFCRCGCPLTFQSTLPARGATDYDHGQLVFHRISIHAPRTGSDAHALGGAVQRFHFNPRSPHGERHEQHEILHRLRLISIHAPRTGSDRKVPNQEGHHARISIHAPRTGSDDDDNADICTSHDFNPRSPHGERPEVEGLLQGAEYFNPRSPHGERLCFAVNRAEKSAFQSTLPARGATEVRQDGDCLPRISIHAPRTGSDCKL